MTINLKSKKGSYFVEAGITLPLFILSVVAMALMINIVSICENIGFVTAMELKNIDVEANYVKLPVFVEDRIEAEVLDENPKLNSFDVTNLDYLYRANDIDDLICVDWEARFKVENPVGILGKVDFKMGLMSRGFTGKTEQGSPLDAADFMAGDSEMCFIFPKYGERYHSKSCWYVTVKYKDEGNYVEIQKEEAKRKGYTPCKLCCGGDGVSLSGEYGGFYDGDY